MSWVEWVLIGCAILATGPLGLVLGWAYGQWQMAEAPVRASGPAMEAPPVFVRSWKPLTPEQWAAAFREWPETDPRWRAVWDMTCHYLESELAMGESIPAEKDAIVQWHGRVQMMLAFRSQLLMLRSSGEGN